MFSSAPSTDEDMIVVDAEEDMDAAKREKKMVANPFERPVVTCKETNGWIAKGRDHPVCSRQEQLLSPTLKE